MKIMINNDNIKCDRVLCYNTSKYTLTLDSYKGNFYFCEDCFNSFQKLIKDTKRTNGNK